MKLFRAIRTDAGFDIEVQLGGFLVIVATLVLWGFAVHVADRLIFG